MKMAQVGRPKKIIEPDKEIIKQAIELTEKEEFVKISYEAYEMAAQQARENALLLNVKTTEQTIQSFIIDPIIKNWIMGGVPVQKAEFQSAVNNTDGVPENNFSELSQNASRRVQMWWTVAGLLCKHKDKFFITPTANVKHAHFK